MNVDHVPPKSKPMRFLWKWKMRVETTFALNMLEPWEKSIVYSIFSLVTVLFWYSVFTYTPGHLAFLRRRFHYYVYGTELSVSDIANLTSSASAATQASTRRFFASIREVLSFGGGRATAEIQRQAGERGSQAVDAAKGSAEVVKEGVKIGQEVLSTLAGTAARAAKTEL